MRRHMTIVLQLCEGVTPDKGERRRRAAIIVSISGYLQKEVDFNKAPYTIKELHINANMQVKTDSKQVFRR